MWPLRGPRTARASRRLLSRTWMKLSDVGTCAAVWLPFPNAQPCPKSPGSEPACREGREWSLGSLGPEPVCGHRGSRGLCGDAQPDWDVRGHCSPTSQPAHVVSGLAFMGPHVKPGDTSLVSQPQALSGWKLERAFPEKPGPQGCGHSVTPPQTKLDQTSDRRETALHSIWHQTDRFAESDVPCH